MYCPGLPRSENNGDGLLKSVPASATSEEDVQIPTKSYRSNATAYNPYKSTLQGLTSYSGYLNIQWARKV